MIKLPHFETEAEEADWWFNNQDLIAEELERTRPKLGPSRAVRRLAEIRGISLEEMQEIMRAHSAEPADDKPLSKLPRSA